MNTDAVDKVSEIIGVLCEKLGTTAQYLIPELAKMSIATYIFDVIVWGIVTLVSGIFAVFFYKKHVDDEYDVAYMVLAIVCLCVAVVGFIIFSVCGEELVGWIASPTAKAVMMILKNLKG